MATFPTPSTNPIRGWIAISFVGLLTVSATAQTADAAQKFPYAAVVRVEGAYVRSGPGKSYYPTERLARGVKVTIHRHDPGGWFMVAPPTGSFSWIRAEYVRQTGPKKGQVTADNVVVRVGSSFGDETRNVEQVRLSKGDVVDIIEKKTVESEQGPLALFKIQPPKGEYRWIAGQDVSAANEIVRNEQDRNPFMTPSNARREPTQPTGPTNPNPQPERVANSPDRLMPRDANAGPAPVGEPFQTETLDSPEDGIRRNGPDLQEKLAQKAELQRLDDEFRNMVDRPTKDWQFDQLTESYRQLKKHAVMPAIASQIELRFEALERYEEIKSEYDNLMKLTSETRKRDAELLSLQKKNGGEKPLSETLPTLEMKPEAPAESSESRDPFAQPPSNPAPPSPASSQGTPKDKTPDAQGWMPSGSADEKADRPTPPPSPQPSRPVPNPAPGPNPNPVPNPGPTDAPQFDGAGIVQRTPAVLQNFPRHVLITPKGRVLAYLQATPGMNLDRFVGHAYGLHGKRFYRDDLRTDLIIVEKLTPVRLAP
ncbi:SH3 domain-containing protein [Thalassoroseus pseudoceratinae]|uniref:SH3 domain-containing protein n=1 Tax=Thalassoroseus pseudoceratinae TaxID=2713176 RepID=UPI00141DA381|nr:SH3 domain-containing protein [Thalassoroseus pseudoceratinae]